MGSTSLLELASDDILHFHPVIMLHVRTGLSSPLFSIQHPCHVWLTQQVPCRYLVGFTLHSPNILFRFFQVPHHGMLIQLLLSGGGVGGLTLAFALSKSPNIHVDIYEAASKFAEIGAGIGVWWRSRQILASLGLEEHIIHLLSSPPGQDQGNQEGICRCMRQLKTL